MLKGVIYTYEYRYHGIAHIKSRSLLTKFSYKALLVLTTAVFQLSGLSGIDSSQLGTAVPGTRRECVTTDTSRCVIDDPPGGGRGRPADSGGDP